MVENPEKALIYGVILAGGRGRRMGNRSKPLMPLGNGCLIDQVVSRASPQVAALCLSVNHNQQDYAYLGLPMIADGTQAYAGPLSGIVSAMGWLTEEVGLARESGLLACFPGDVPWFPNDLVKRLSQRMRQERVDAVLVETDGQLQPLFSLWRLSVFSLLQQALEEGLYGPKLVLPRIRHALLKISPASAGEFLNINTVDELKLAQKLARDG